jgi:hypothetical protein
LPAVIHSDDIPPDIAKTIGVPAKHRAKGRAKPADRLTKDAVRSYALKCLAPLSDLTRSARARVLAHASRINSL